MCVLRGAPSNTPHTPLASTSSPLFPSPLTPHPTCRALAAESRMMLEEMEYTPSASSTEEAMPTVKQSSVSTGSARQQASTRGVTR